MPYGKFCLVNVRVAWVRASYDWPLQTGRFVKKMAAHLDVPTGPGSLAAARQFVKSVLIGWGFDNMQRVDDAVLIADELVANAVRHGGGCLRLEVHARDAEITVCAVDGSAVVPRRRDPDDNGGRGLRIIEALGQAWGVEDLPRGGKRVWVRIAGASVSLDSSTAATRA